MRKHLEITLTTRAISPPNRERPSSSPRRHTLHPDVEERYARLHPFTAATLAARTTAAPEPPPPPVDAAAAAKETQPLPRVHGKRQPSPPPLARPWSAQHRADGAYHFDWRVLYDEAAAAAESLVSENTEARAACVQQAQLIDGQRTRLQQLAVERRRLGAGEVAPSWVVSGIESHLASVEAERNLLRAEAVKAELKLREEAIEQARLGAQRDELERQQKEMVSANAALRDEIDTGRRDARALQAEGEALQAEVARLRAAHAALRDDKRRLCGLLFRPFDDGGGDGGDGGDDDGGGGISSQDWMDGDGNEQGVSMEEVEERPPRRRRRRRRRGGRRRSARRRRAARCRPTSPKSSVR